MRIFVTGGAGYIGSHTVLQLLEAEHEVLVYDNLTNASPEAIERVKKLAGKNCIMIKGDCRDFQTLSNTMKDFKPDAIIHFAGWKAVGESVEKPLDYYENNVWGSVQLLKAMDQNGVHAIVFSSTATVYGKPEYLPLDEAHQLSPESPYGRSKLMVEEIIRDWAQTHTSNSAALLRYFNPVGAHESGEIGEDPKGIPNNLMPFVQQVAIGRREALIVHGDDYETRDGTGERDYIHVDDLAKAHLCAVEYTQNETGVSAINIGTGNGATVLEVIDAFKRNSNRDIPYQIGARRAGDVAASLASNDKAKSILGWEAEHDLDTMTRSAWNFQQKNPNGYED